MEFQTPTPPQSANAQPSKKHPLIFYAEIALPLILVAGLIGWALYRTGEKEVTEQEQKKEETAEFQEKVQRLRDLEKDIEETKKQLEEVSSLSPEERARLEEERKILSASRVTKDVAVKGVEVQIRDEKKTILNRVEGYRIEVPLNLVIARSISSNWLEFHDQKNMCLDPDCDPVMRIRTVSVNPRNLTLNEWLAEEEKRANAEIYSPREKLTIGNETAYRVTEEIPGKFEGYYYYLGRGTKIYDIRISKFDDEIYRSASETFSFVPTP